VIPVIGITPRTPPTLMIACTVIHVVMPGRNHASEGVRGAAGHRPSRDCEEGEQGQHHRGSHETGLLADDREDEVGVGVGQVEPAGTAASQTHPEHAAGAEGVVTLDELPAGSAGVRPRVEEADEPVPPITGG
jgi:hypothetical protein